MNPGSYSAFTNASGCNSVSGCSLVNGHELRFAPGSYGDMHGTNSVKIHLTAGTYNINSLSMDNETSIIVDSGPVIINLVGAGVGGNSDVLLVNSSVTLDPAHAYDPSMLQINYAGTARVQWNNEATSILQLNAPNATVNVRSSEVYGSIIGNTVNFNNAATLHFDRHLLTHAPTTFQVGNDMLTSFTWKKY